MLINDIIKHVELYEYDSALNKIKQAISTDENKIEAYLLLLKIYNLQSNPEIQKIEKEFYNYVKNNKKYEEFFEYIQKGTTNFNIYKKSYEMQIFYMEALWNLGKIKEFRKYSEKFNISLLDNKNYAKYISFTEFVESKIKHQSYITIGKTIFYCETGNAKALEVYLEEYKKNILKKRRSEIEKDLVVYKSLLSTLKMYKDSDTIIYWNYLYFDLFKNFISQTNVDYRNLLEYILLAKNDNDLCLVLELDIKEEIKQEITTLLKKNGKVRVTDVPRAFTETRKKLQANITMAKKGSVSTGKEEKSIHEYKLYKLEGQSGTDNINLNTEYIMSELEKKTLSEMEHQIGDYSNLESLVTSFIELEMFMVAKMISDKMDHSSNKSYLLSKVNYEMQNYSEVVLLVNQAINDFKLEADHKLPFLYLKAQSLKNLGLREELERVLFQIKSIDPSFKQIKELRIV